MTFLPAAFLLAMALATSVVSGIFGAAGGLMLMGALAVILPVQAAMVTHGVIQAVSNGWRMALHRRHVRWDIIGWYVAGSAISAVAMWLLALVPSKPLLFALMGLSPLLTWLPRRWIRLDAARPAHGLAAGMVTTGVNLMAGVSGPLADIFFIRTELTRHAIVATKATAQVFAHLAKIAVYGAPLLASAKGGGAGMPPAWVFALAIPLSMLGNALGGRILARMTDGNFRRWARWLITAVGAAYLVQAIQLLTRG